MSKRLQVVMSHDEFHEVQRAADDEEVSVLGGCVSRCARLVGNRLQLTGTAGPRL